MKGIIDRFEGKFAVIELDDGKMSNIEIGKLPAGVIEGDCVYFDGGVWVIGREKTAAKKEQIENLMKDVFE